LNVNNTAQENIFGSAGAIIAYVIFNYAPPKPRWSVFASI